MDWFSFCLTGITLVIHSALHLFFLLRLTQKMPKLWYFALYFILLSILETICTFSKTSTNLAVAAQTVTLYGMSRFAIKNPSSLSWTVSILAVYISQLSFGIINGLEIMVIPPSQRGWLLYGLVLMATLLSFLLCAGCYLLVIKLAPFQEVSSHSSRERPPMPYIQLLLFPCLFFFSAELYILQTAYQALPGSWSLALSGKQLILISLQSLGLGAMLCTLHAYQRICRSFQTQARMDSLAQSVQLQKTYLDEARIRSQKTRAFRHDIRNHLSVLRGLLEQGKADQAKNYLEGLEGISSSLSLPWHTGNPVVDILLEEKLGFAGAKGIHTEVSLVLPGHCQVEDIDLCTIFANALDNAITACQAAHLPDLDKPAPFIRIKGECQGDFYLLEFENTCSPCPLPPIGTGLSNIQTAAQAYHGTILTEADGSSFRLNVLLNISLQPDSRSGQFH